MDPAPMPFVSHALGGIERHLKSSSQTADSCLWLMSFQSNSMPDAR